MREVNMIKIELCHKLIYELSIGLIKIAAGLSKEIKKKKKRNLEFIGEQGLKNIWESKDRYQTKKNVFCRW